MDSVNCTSRDERFSFLQVFAIILVVVGHSFYQHEGNPVFYWIYTFHMPLFFFISGYLLRNSVLRSGKSLGEYCGWRFVLKKAKRLLLPYWLLSSLVFLPKSLMGSFAGRPVDASFESYAYMLLHPLENVISIFWFLPTLFLVFMLVACGGKIAGLFKLRKGCLLGLAVSFPLTFFFDRYSTDLLDYQGVLAFLFFFVLGYAVRGVDWCVVARKKFVLFPVCFAISFAPFLLPEDVPGLDTLFACNGILMALAFAEIYVGCGCRFFKPFYGCSYTVYLFSWFFQVASQQVFLSVTGLPWGYGTALAITLGFFGPFAIYKSLVRFDEIRFVRWMKSLFV